MGLKSIKEKIISSTNKAVNFTAKKLSNSKVTIRDKKTLDEIINKSKTTSIIDKETGKRRTFKKRVIIIFGSERSNFFRQALIDFPILATKAFSQNITFKLAISKIEDVKLEDYGITKIPCLVVFENKKVIKIVTGQENIQKLVKSFNLDINKQLDNL